MTRARLVSLGAAGILLLAPVACGDDDAGQEQIEDPRGGATEAPGEDVELGETP